MRRCMTVAAALVATVAMACPSWPTPAWAQQAPIVLKAGTAVGVTSPLNDAMIALDKTLQEKSKGRIKIELHINNSIANRAIREQIVKTFQGRGYALNNLNPDFAVAFYASAREKMDVTAWDYGYPFMPGWPGYRRQIPQVTQYTEGSIVIDVVRAGTRELLWRGEGRAELSDDAAENVKQLAKMAEKIISRFPQANVHVVASRQ